VTGAEAIVREAIAARGPLPFSEVVEVALYDPTHGFYAAGGRAGRRGDFLTSAEVGPLFGAVVARALDAWWRAAGEPERCTVVEAGAGPGTLARAIRAAAPACGPALRSVLVERSGAQRAQHDALVASAGGAVRSQAALPDEVEGPCLVLANELLDNLPFDVVERTPDGWVEVRVDALHPDRALVEVPGRPVPGPWPDDAPVGTRLPVQRAAGEWLRGALALVGPAPHGRVVVLDYGGPTAELVARGPDGWLRTYRQHERGGPPLEDLGTQDITSEVDADQLSAVAPATRTATQADWLAAHGIDELVEEGRRIWRERAAIGDLAAVRARSRIGEAEALRDPSGLGAFRVWEWDR
jgi:SAM-dependent MidA family methyltransferase